MAARVGNQARFIAATDAELVLASTAGDRDAVAVVWDRYAKASRQCLRTKLGFQDVEDLLQDVFVAFLTSVHRIRNQDSLRAYLLAIAAKLANHDMRRRRTRRVVSLSDTGEMPDVASPPPDFEGRESLLALQHALDRMPLRVRLGYCLFHFSGLDLKEVARTLGVSSATAKRALARARRRLVRLEGRTPSWSKIEKERS